MPKPKIDESVLSTIAIHRNDVAIFRELATYTAEQLGTEVYSDAERMTAFLRYVYIDKMRRQGAGGQMTDNPPITGPFAAILGSHQSAPALVEKPHIVLSDFVGIDTQAQLADIRRWNPEADDAWIREMAIDAIYYQLEPTVEEPDVDRQIDRIRNIYGYDATNEQLLAIGVDQLHYEWRAAQSH